MLIAFALFIAALASYFTTPWFGLPFAALLFVILRALQFLTVLYSREELDAYRQESDAYERLAQFGIHPRNDPLGSMLPMELIAPRPLPFFVASVAIMSLLALRWFDGAEIPNTFLFTVLGASAVVIWFNAPAVGISLGLGFVIGAIAIAGPSVAYLLGVLPFGN